MFFDTNRGRLLLVGECPTGALAIVEVLDIFDKMKVVGPRACFSDRGLSHRTFDQVIDTKFGSVVGPRS